MESMSSAQHELVIADAIKTTSDLAAKEQATSDILQKSEDQASNAVTQSEAKFTATSNQSQNVISQEISELSALTAAASQSVEAKNGRLLRGRLRRYPQ